MRRLLICFFAISALSCKPRNLAARVQSEETLAVPSDQISELDLNPRWTCSVGIVGSDIWLKTKFQNNAVYQYRLGGGGAIAEIVDVSKNKTLLAPTHQGEHTDRVVQYVSWSIQLTNELSNLLPFERRFNVNQAGTVENKFSATLQVIVYQDRCAVDIYSLQHKQWLPIHDPVLTGKLSGLTRYQIVGNGGLNVLRYVLVGEARKNGVSAPHREFYLEAWTPMTRKNLTAIAFNFNTDATPGWYERFDDNTATYPNRRDSELTGQATLFHENAPKTNDAISVLYSSDPGCVVTQTGCDRSDKFWQAYNQMLFEQGMAVLPGLTAIDLAPGGVLQHEFSIQPLNGIFTSTLSTIYKLQKKIRRPRLINKDQRDNSDISEIIAKLQKNFDETNISESKWHTENLARFIQ